MCILSMRHVHIICKCAHRIYLKKIIIGIKTHNDSCFTCCYVKKNRIKFSKSQHIIFQMRSNLLLIIFYRNHLVLKRIENKILAKIHNGGILQDSVCQIWRFQKPIIFDIKLKKTLCWSFLQKGLGPENEQGIRYWVKYIMVVFYGIILDKYKNFKNLSLKKPV